MKKSVLTWLSILFIMVLLLAIPVVSLAADFSGIAGPTLVKDEYGTWNYIVNGEVCYDYTLVKYNNAWWHVEGGTLCYDEEIVPYNGKYYYVNDSRVQFGFSGVVWCYHAELGTDYYLIKNGVLDTSAVAFADYDGTTMYFKNGVQCFDNTLVKYNNEWWHVHYGSVCEDQAIIPYNGRNYFVNQGKVQFGFTGVTGASDADYNWNYYNVSAGVATGFANGLTKVDGTWYYYVNGQICYDRTLVKYNGAWWHVENGQLCTASEIVPYNGVNYYVKDGKLQSAFTGIVEAYDPDTGNGIYSITKGVVSGPYTGLVKLNGEWRYVVDGWYNYDRTLVKYNGAWWSVDGSRLTNYEEFVLYNGKMYYTDQGKLQSAFNDVAYAYDPIEERYVYRVVKNGVVDTAFTGTYTTSNGRMYYFRNGLLAEGDTLIKIDGEWLAYLNGKHYDTDPLTVTYNGKEYYVNHGKVYLSTTGVFFAETENGYECVIVKNGVVDRSKQNVANGLVEYGNDLVYIKDGYICTDHTLVKYDGIWYQVEGGVPSDYIAFVPYNGKTYYAWGQVVDFDFTGVESAYSALTGNYETHLVVNGVVDTKVDTSVNGLVKSNGVFVYIKDGAICNDHTLAKYNGEWYRVNEGTVSYTDGIVEYNGKEYYVEDGKVNFGFTGFKRVWDDQEYEYYYVVIRNGVVDRNKQSYADGVAQLGGTLGYFKDGYLANACYLVKYNNQWWYFMGGVVMDEFDIVVSYNGADYYLSNGCIDFSYSGLAYADYYGEDEEYYGLFLIEKGVAVMDLTGYEDGLVEIDGDLCYIKDGQFCMDTTLVKHNGEWWFVDYGKVDTWDELVVEYNGKQYYVKEGKVDFTKTGTIVCRDPDYYYNCYEIVNGVVTKTYEFGAPGLQKINGTWVYFDHDGWVGYASGLVKYNGALWYVRNGMLDTSEAFVNYRGRTYYVDGGKVQTGKSGIISAYNESTWAYECNVVKNGIVDRSVQNYADGLVKVDGTLYYFKGGRICMDRTLVKHEGVWYYVQDGSVNNYWETVVTYNGAQYYVDNGKVQFGTTGPVAAYDENWNLCCYMVEKGVVKSKVTDKPDGLVKIDGVWFCFQGGRLNSRYGFYEYNGEKWFINEGKVDFTEAFIIVSGKEYYVKNGMLQSNYTGNVTLVGSWDNFRYGTWTVEKGVVTKFTPASGYTLGKKDGEFWLFKDGEFASETRLVEYAGSTWYVSNGMLDKEAVSVTIGGKTYGLSNGKVVSGL